jgi:dihydroflavonol-4-reductase
VKVLVLGAGGFLGLHIVDALRSHGIDARCGRRRPGKTLALRARGLPLVDADLEAPEQLRAAMRGADVVVHAAGHYPRHSLDRAGTLETGLRQSENVLNAALAVPRLVYVSSTATVAPGGDEAARWPDPPGLGVYHDLKWAMEQVFSPHPGLVVACPAGCLGAHDHRVGTAGLLVATARGEDPPHPDGIVNLVDAADVGEAVARLVVHPSPPPRVILSGSNLRLHELLLSLARRYRVRRPSAPVAPDAMLALADAEEAAASRERRRPRLSREIVDLVVHGHPVDATLATRVLGMAWTPLGETLDRFDAWARLHGLIPTLPPEAHP